MQKTFADHIAEEAKRLDGISYQAGDVLDVKASTVLLAVTFLCTLSGQIVSVPDLRPTIKVIQVVAVAALCLSGLLTICALRPRDFDIPRDPKKLTAYVNALGEISNDKPKQMFGIELQTKSASPAFAISSSSTPLQFEHRISPGVNFPSKHSPTNTRPHVGF